MISPSVVFESLRSHGMQPARLLCPWGFSRQVYWSGLPCPPPGDLPDPGIKPRSPALQVDSLPSEPPGKPMCMHISPLFWIPFPYRSSQRTEKSSLCLLSRFSLVIYFIHSINNVCRSIPISQLIPPPPLPPLVSIYLFSMAVSLFLLCPKFHLEVLFLSGCDIFFPLG